KLTTAPATVRIASIQYLDTGGMRANNSPKAAIVLRWFGVKYVQ
ncbi:15879_t:CDS:1, partial [Acaulospora colombiana]